ncbi:MAG: sulfotransferase family protein [Nocardioidaceae bacterium]
MHDHETGDAATPSEHWRQQPRRLVLVAGSGRSGTSTMSGILRQLGLYVPQPEVAADNSNPRGFGEPQVVVDLHNALLSRAGVHASDARPTAWGLAEEAVTESVQSALDRWVDAQFVEAEAAFTTEIVIKDPRLAWFLPMWQQAAERADAAACVVTMLRPPSEVVGSKSRYYGGRMADSNRTAAWVNMMLQTEHATRSSRRAFVSYHALLEDWTTALYRAGETLGLSGIENAATDDIRRVHQFVDPSLRRVKIGWSDIEVPDTLRALADDTWEQLSTLVEPTSDEELVHKRLDELREAYARLYHDAELVAMSSVIAARRTRPDPAATPAKRALARSRAERFAHLIPHGFRAKIPAGVRHRARAGIARLRGGGR